MAALTKRREALVRIGHALHRLQGMRSGDGGGMASLRNDPLGKGMAQMLLDMPVEVPARLLQEVKA